jgi:spoIIIJ-associated protein
VAHAEASARTVEAAVAAAAAQLGLRPHQVDFEVLEEPVPSTFGYIGTPARVRATARAVHPGSGGPRSIGAGPEGTGTGGRSGVGAEAPSAPSPSVARAPEAPEPTLASAGPSPSAAAPAAPVIGDRSPDSVARATDQPGGSSLRDETLPSGIANPSTSSDPSSTASLIEEGPSTADAPDVSTMGRQAATVASDPENGEVRRAARIGEGASHAGVAVGPSDAPASSAPDIGDAAPEAVWEPARSRATRSSRGTSRDRDEPIQPQMVEEDTERAGDFLEGLLDALDVDGDITTWVDEVGGHIDLEGPDLDILVGPNGETLDSVQELTRLAVLRQSKRRVRLLIDINGFRAQHREQLITVVKAAAEQVIRTREDHEFEPMTPAERKVVHDAVAAIDGVRTESRGEEPVRRVVIRPA